MNAEQVQFNRQQQSKDAMKRHVCSPLVPYIHSKLCSEGTGGRSSIFLDSRLLEMISNNHSQNNIVNKQRKTELGKSKRKDQNSLNQKDSKSTEVCKTCQIGNEKVIFVDLEDQAAADRFQTVD